MTIEIGQCFLKTDAVFMGPWQVVSIHIGKGSVPHARLVRVAQPEDQKTVSVHVLRDRRHYRPHDPFGTAQRLRAGRGR